jgi:hypothetical protein
MIRQEQEKMIREVWFPEHRASLNKSKVGESTVEQLVWRKPGASCYYTRYLWSNGYLFVTGDIGDAIYRFGAPTEDAMRWVTGCELDYFASKCEASEDGRGYKSWDADEAKRELLGMVGLMSDPGRVRAWLSEYDAYDALGSQGEWSIWLSDFGDEVFGSDWSEWAPNIGMKVDMRCHGHLIGLKMAMAQLSEGRSK